MPHSHVSANKIFSGLRQESLWSTRKHKHRCDSEWCDLWVKLWNVNFLQFHEIQTNFPICLCSLCVTCRSKPKDTGVRFLCLTTNCLDWTHRKLLWPGWKWGIFKLTSFKDFIRTSSNGKKIMFWFWLTFLITEAMGSSNLMSGLSTYAETVLVRLVLKLCGTSNTGLLSPDELILILG